MKLTYSDVYNRMALLTIARQFASNGKTIAEILRLKAAYVSAFAEIESKKQIIKADEEADEETKNKAFNDAVFEECSAPDRRLSLDAFESIADKALASDEPVDNGYGGKLPPDAWLEILFATLVEQPTEAAAEAEADILPHDRPDKEE